MTSGPAPRVAFLRPQLGIGGSERLVVDAATQLQSQGCDVRIFVASEDGPQFDEIARRDAPVDVSGSWLPAHVGGRLRAPLAVAQTARAARRLASCAGSIDVVVCDVVAHVVPFVKRLTGRPVLFYCHFPDLLLTPAGARSSLLYRLYRRPIDAMERAGLRAADAIVVNSRFTASVLRDCVPGLAGRVYVIHPGVRVPTTVYPVDHGAGGEIRILSVGRFDPRKNLPLAVESLAALRQLLPRELFARVRLVLTGHFDVRLSEPKVLVEELRALCRAHELTEHVRTIFSPTSAERDALLQSSRCVIYTPNAEHFGYVPLEAMASARPVVAVNHGGPTETIRHGVTGRLCAPSAQDFAAALCHYVMDPRLADRTGLAGRAHVEAEFSVDALGARLRSVVDDLAGTGILKCPSDGCATV